MSRILAFIFLFATSALLSLALSSCTSSPTPTLPSTSPTALNPTGTNPNSSPRQTNTRTALSNYCPSAETRTGTATHRIFRSGADKSDTNSLSYQGTITKISRECHYVGANLEIRVGVRARIITGPRFIKKAILPLHIILRRENCSYLSKSYNRTALFPSGSSYTTLRFVSDTLKIPAPKDTNVLLYVGFDNKDIKNPSLPPCRT